MTPLQWLRRLWCWVVAWWTDGICYFYSHDFDPHLIQAEWRHVCRRCGKEIR